MVTLAMGASFVHSPQAVVALEQRNGSAELAKVLFRV
jgi:hypothetical protein